MSTNDDELRDLFGQKNSEDQFPYNEENWKAMDSFLDKEAQAENQLGEFFKTTHKEEAYAYDAANWQQMEKFLQQEKKRRLAFYFVILGFVIGSLLLLLGKPDHESNPELSERNKKHETAATGSAPNLAKQVKSGDLTTTARTKGKTEQAKSFVPSLGKENKSPEKNKETRPQTAYQETTFTEIPTLSKASERSSPATTEAGKPAKGRDPNIYSTTLAEQQQPPLLETDPTETTWTQTGIRKDSSHVVDTKIMTVTKDSIPNSKQTSAPSYEPLRDSLNQVVVTMPSPSLAVSDSVSHTDSPSLDSLLSELPPTHAVFAELGGTYLVGWSGNDKQEAKGLNPYVGFNYYRAITKQLGISLGIGYSSVHHLRHTQHTSYTTQLRFGEELDVTVISATQLHYLYIPLRVTYAPHPKNLFAFGYNFGCLVDAKSKVETYQTGPVTTNSPKISQAWGYTKGFNPFDGQLAVCYRRQLYQLIYVNAEVFYGLQDIKKNSIYNLNTFERNSGIKISLAMPIWSLKNR